MHEAKPTLPVLDLQRSAAEGIMMERPFSQLLKDLMFSCSALVRSEIKLAAVEARQSALEASRNFLKAAIFFGIAYFGAISLLAFLVMGLGELLDNRYWLSALIVGLVLTVLGVTLGLRARENIQEGNSHEHAELERSALG